MSAVIARRYNNNDPISPCGFNRLAHWIERITFEDRTTQRKIDDANIEEGLQLNRCIDRGDYRTICSSAILIKHAKVDDVRAGSDAFESPCVVLSGGAGAVTSNQACDMRAMSVLIRRAAVTWNETLIPYHARSAKESAL